MKKKGLLKTEQSKKASEAMPVEEGELMGNSIEEGVENDTRQATNRISIPEQVNASRALEAVNATKERRSSVQRSAASVSGFRTELT